MINKKLYAIVLSTLLVFNMLSVYGGAQEVPVWKEFYISSAGNDSFEGTKDQPFKTLQRAKDAVRDVSEQMQGDIIVNIEGGEYFLEKTLDFTIEDSGKNGFSVIYKGNSQSMPLISAGRTINGFAPSPDYPGIYEANAESFDYIRELYVNDEIRFLAQSPVLVTGVKKPAKYDTVEWYASNPGAPAGDSYNYYDPNTVYSYDGLYMSKEDIGFWNNPEDIELCWYMEWESKYMKIKSIEENPDDDSSVIVRMEPGLWEHLRVRNSNGFAPRGEKPFYIRNAMELLDTPGEFYHNRKTKKLYYMPKVGEDITTAKVIVPVLDAIALFTGTHNQKVQGITFENIKFAHNSCNYFGETSVEIWQGASLNTQAGKKLMSGAFVLNRAKNINFYNNYFYGLGTAALNMPNGVEDCNVKGNAFADIGAAAIMIGSPGHDDERIAASVTPPSPTPKLNLVNVLDCEVGSSYFGNNYNLRGFWGALYVVWPTKAVNYEDGYEYGAETQGGLFYGGAWKGDPHAPQKGEKSWMRLDFLREYKIDEIAITFNPKLISDQEKTGYEILLSNDRYFKEYTVVATQTTTPGTQIEYSVPTSEKFRYMMIRTLDATPFALSKVYAFTSDIKAYTMYQRCKNIEFSNNYIKRASITSENAGGMMVFYTENAKILHNELIDIPYTAIQAGWGWRNYLYGSYNNIYAYNYIENCTRLFGDGGGIYSLGRSVGTVIENNYFSRMNKGHGAIYLDQGTASTVWRNNVVSNTGKIYHAFHQPSLIENEIYNIYATGSIFTNNTTPGANRIDALINYPEGNPPKEVYTIMRQAGLEDNYKHLRSWVSNTKSKLMPDYVLGSRVALVDNGEKVLSSENFGKKFGQYSLEYKYKLQKAMEDYSNADRTYEATKRAELNSIIYEADSNLKRLPLPDMLLLCKKIISSAKVFPDNSVVCDSISLDTMETTTDAYPKSKFDAFKECVEAVERLYNGGITVNDEYDLLVSLENAINTLDDYRFSADIDYVHVENAKNVEINKKDKKVTVTMPWYETSGEKAISIYTHGTAKPADIISTVKIGETKKFPVYCEGNRTYTYWDISVKCDNVNDSQYVLTSKDWFSKSGDSRKTITTDDGILITPSPYAAMAKKYSAERKGASVKFIPVSSAKINKFKIILGAKTFDEFELNNNNASNNRYEVRFGHNATELYHINGKNSTLIATTPVSIKYNEINTLSYSLEDVGTSTNIIVSLNGEVLFDKINSKVPGYYMGFQSDKIHIKVVD